MRLTTNSLPDDRTYARVSDEALTLQEKRHIMEGDLGYCAAHRILYRRTALIQCVVYLLCCKCEDPDCRHTPKLKQIGPCDEWSLTTVAEEEEKVDVKCRACGRVLSIPKKDNWDNWDNNWLCAGCALGDESDGG